MRVGKRIFFFAKHKYDKKNKWSYLVLPEKKTALGFKWKIPWFCSFVQKNDEKKKKNNSNNFTLLASETLIIFSVYGRRSPYVTHNYFSHFNRARRYWLSRIGVIVFTKPECEHLSGKTSLCGLLTRELILIRTWYMYI